MFIPRLLLTLVLLAATAQTVRGHGAYHELLAEVDKELVHKPGDAGLLKRRAALHIDHEEWKTALVDLEHAERQGAPAGDLDFLRGQALLQGGFYAHAEAALAAYLRAHPADVPALAARARSLEKLGRHAEATQDYRRALQATAPPAEDLILEAAAAFAAQGALDEAVAAVRQGLPGASPALLAQSLHYELEARHLDAALARVEALQKMAVRPEPWMARRAQILAQAGQVAEARTAWMALRDHLQALPSLERGTPLTGPLLAECQRALGGAVPAQVMAPPAPSPPPPSNPLSLPKP